MKSIIVGTKLTELEATIQAKIWNGLLPNEMKAEAEPYDSDWAISISFKDYPIGDAWEVLLDIRNMFKKGGISTLLGNKGFWYI